MNRHTFTPRDTVACLWNTLSLPLSALDSLNLVQDGDFFPSSFKVDHLAQSTIALSALAAALFHATRNDKSVPRITVSAEHACVEFKSERLYVLNGKPAPSSWGTIGGLHKAKDGYVRMHDSFPSHRKNALRILDLKEGATREDVARKMLDWKAIDLETTAFRRGAVIVALRSFGEWGALPQAQAVADLPILIDKAAEGKPYIGSTKGKKCLSGIRVVEMSRVIAAPVAGKTLAAHGADVIWITSPNLPDLPDLDRDLARGKRTVQLDIKNSEDKAKLLKLLRTADVFIQGYRPGSLAGQGLSTEELVRLNPNLIIANLSAWGLEGPWAQNRGFDSLVQTASGINVADAERFGAGEPARVLPCQAFDHGAGYLLATGVTAALYKRAVDGGAYEVNVSLAGVMKYIRSLGQYSEKTGFGRKDFTKPEDVELYLESRESGFGELKAVKHAARIEGINVGWDVMPKPLGSDEPQWLQG
ncbi:CoA-transferase family III domain-containing protein [Lophiotrema nucula]|uniref:CoA-transferase family III domain-containing protein n=1 Tax=Lophiotrema nucula TaxID=690887 RepID=A0A6A5Z300_9PLEO|nr:CoA-transferase family III domain-containing protein [Lophiotrema nucula]